MIGDEGLFAGQHFVGDHGERKLIRASIHGVPLHLLGRHVVGRPHHDAGHGHLLGKNFGDAEVGDLRGRALVDQNIGGLDVAMDDALLVRVIERRRGLVENGEHGVAVERMLRCSDTFSSGGPSTHSMKM